MVSNFSKSSQPGKETLKLWACTCTFVAISSFHTTYLSTWGVSIQVFQGNLWVEQYQFEVALVLLNNVLGKRMRLGFDGSSEASSHSLV